MCSYYDNWKTDEFNCKACNWRGSGSSLILGELYDELLELNCPACNACVTHIMYPTTEESRANWDKLSDAERHQVEMIERRIANFADRKLRDMTPLPDLNTNSFVLHWDCLDASYDSETLILFGETVIFREPATYENYNRFIKVAELLKARYGNALCDLIPTTRSKTYLYGDCMSSLDTVAMARERIFHNKAD